jgi:zinc protease
MIRTGPLPIALSLIVGTAIAGAAAQPPVVSPIKMFALANGLTVVLAPSKAEAGCTVFVTYNTGSRAEQPGQTGVAHLLEHMMFRGSRNVGRGEHASIVAAIGGVYNGSTGPDRTVFNETIPFCDDLPIVFELEADRMSDLQLTIADFEKEREVVLEELRQRTDGGGMARVREILDSRRSTEFELQHGVQGSAEDIAHLTVDTLARFYANNYQPASASVIVTGNFDPQRIGAQVRRYFGPVRKHEITEIPKIGYFPGSPGGASQSGEKPLRVRRPRLDVGFLMPPGNTPEWYAALAMGYVLAGTTPSRLEREFQGQHVTAASVWSVEHGKGQTLGIISLQLPQGADIDEAEKLVRRVLVGLSAEAVPAHDLEQYRLGMAREYFRSVDTTLARADTLSKFLTFYQDPSLLNTFLDHVNKVAPEEIKMAAMQCLKEEHLLVLRSVPEDPDGR